MRPSLFSGSGGRTATYLCAACRREARAMLSTRSVAAPIAAQRTLQNAAIPPAQRAATRRWPVPTQQARYTSTSASPKPAETPSSPPNPSTIPTYYALFPETLPDGPPPTGKFPIDLRALRNEFLRLQAASHPDFHHSASQTSPTPPTQGNTNNNTKSAARLHAEATSAQINAAYKTLSSPLLRAQYLLREQHGVDLEGDEAGSQAAPDAELLMTVLEAREVIEEAETEADLEEVRVANEVRIEECEARLGEALEGGDVQAAKEEAVRLRYWVNIREGVRGWERGKPVVLQH
ncbi:HSCB C-terminal oligomerization domain-containing protein [Chaetomium tenue]|uniref:HSCB C-terminal oligomerization domain-containing protein n=1 Tax=Chaetomium tenue TaxID=1854479 RepID=A0ACB7P2U4_9PEZI|nr:HSCB C-terminal oligomerization domain-containing protein [Chaetomium globosum]